MIRLVAPLVAILCCCQPVPALAQAVTPTVAFGARHAVALAANGDVLTWGDNVGCQLGRPGGNAAGTPGLALRNGIKVAAASEHTLALTADGKVYGWGSNPEGALGVGNTYDQCQGPALVESLAGKVIVDIATGSGFSVALSDTGDLFCSGDNSMGQCPVAKGGRIESFAPVPIPELAGNVVSVKAGAFHVLALTKDGALWAFGRGRDGQLGHGKTVNGLARVPDMTGVVSFSAGTWHSAAVKADGSAWLWGNNGKSQLCDGSTTNRAMPVKVVFSANLNVTEVAAGGHATLLRGANGELYGCGDNQFGALGAGQPPVVPQPALLAAGTRSPGLAVGGANGSFSTDGCTVRVAGSTDRGIAGGTAPVSPFAARAGLSLCGTRPATALPDLVRVLPSGGESGCWTPRLEEDAAASATFAPLKQAMLAAEALLKQNAAFMAAPVPVRMRTSLSAGPLRDAGARMHVKATPERKADGTRLWSTGCTVIPQLDRIGGAIGQISIFFNQDARGQFLGESGIAPKLTGRVGGFPEYNGWVLITQDGRLPWIPQTLGERLDLEGKRRRDALEEWQKSRAGMKVPDAAAIERTYELLKKTDPAGAEKLLASMKAQSAELQRLQEEEFPATTLALEQRLAEFEQYRASFSAEQLRSPAVRGDASGEGKRRLDAEIAAIRALAPEALGLKADATRQARNARAGARVNAATDRYELNNLQPGPAERALFFKPDPAFPDKTAPDRIQVIAISFSEDPDPRQVERKAWQARVKASFDFAALAALIK